MPEFNYSFTVPAPRAAVTAFHHGTSVLKHLSPPPIFVQLHRVQPLAENSEATFTMWFGPIPLRWHAIHSNVGSGGFTDTQVTGPLRHWEHTHRFIAVDERNTRVEEQIRYEHATGLKGWFTRLFFNRPALTLLFTYRQLVTRWALRTETQTATVVRPLALLFAALGLLSVILLWADRQRQRK